MSAGHRLTGPLSQISRVREMTVVLMVAEKPSICNSIAEALSHGSHSTQGAREKIALDSPYIFSV